MTYAKWAALLVLVWIAELLGLIVVPLSNWLGWTRLTWAVWGNDDGEIVDHPDPRDTDKSFRWLAIANRAHNFAKMCGVIAQKYTHEGDLLVSDQGYPGRWFLTQPGAFELYIVRRIILWSPWPLCFRLRIGWKLHGMEGKTAPLVSHVSIRKFRPL